MQLPQYMRRRDGTPVEVIAQGRTFNDTRATVLYIHENTRGTASVGYAMADGRSPNHHTPSDLLPFDIDLCANHIQLKLDTAIYTSMLKLWKAGYQDQVVAAAVKDTDLHPTDMRHYLSGLWG